MQGRKRVAIIGSGCSGIGALWALKSTNHEVHIYEKEARLGGHTNTVTWRHGDRITNVDTGFIVLNSATYPNFINFLKDVKIPTHPSFMTFGVSRDAGLLEWAGTSLSSIFALKNSVFSLRIWQMLFDIVRFNQFAQDLLMESDESEQDPIVTKSSSSRTLKPSRQLSMGDYLQREGYSEAFINDYLVPMTAAVWSTSPDKCTLDFPAITLVRFMWNHHLLTTIGTRAPWFTIKNGTKQYIDAVMADFPKDQVHLSMPVKCVIQDATHLSHTLVFENGTSSEYDHVIFATHGDQTCEILEAKEDEHRILECFKTSSNIAVLHSDLSLMPKRKVAWSSWNYITTSVGQGVIPTVCLTYWMNLLQDIPTETYGDVLVTLNPLFPPNPSTVQGEWMYHHPLYNHAAIQAQKLLPTIQNMRGISYCGAWTKYGFHEDGFSSGIKVAMDHLGAELPFEFVDSTFSRGRAPVLRKRDYGIRFFIRILQKLFLFCRLAFRPLVGWLGDDQHAKDKAA